LLDYAQTEKSGESGSEREEAPVADAIRRLGNRGSDVLAGLT
jgi:hypothetical protein